MNIETSKSFNKCAKIRQAMREEGILTGDRVRGESLERFISFMAGDDPRTLKTYEQRLIKYGFLKLIPEQHRLYEVAK